MSGSSPWRTGTGRVVAGVIVVLVLGVVVGLSALWPRGELPRVPALAGVGSIDRAQVTAISLEGCANFAGPGCRLVTLRLTSGAHKGERSSITLPSPKDEAAPTVVPGDQIRVARNVPGGIDPKLADQLPIDDPSQQPYAFVDFERQSVLLWLAIAFAVVVVGLGRLQGLRSLVGLAVSLFLVVGFVVPAILNGSPALLVALV
ncbi:MAG: YibE/F family protein, partial [Actinomycetota bacterium]|nr:YibE/F family protein [Actinomycetota bacterium]